ncbi:DNA replication ATP-dependent helicase/nuclease DNA2 [Madurella mycetomatis]|uniref:DNA replication ATP-dependent helicase/nuclease DNA2 n=1 Tax=Madurella mycetomatis TaxID=100816 RepID=A0A175VYJ4_9PEZI|nr:DNA replication ATP-dependent helicase/nuclease DNA2 [Madurella mycetomatis]
MSASTRAHHTDQSQTPTAGHVIGLILIASGFTLTGLSFMDPLFGRPPPSWRINSATGYADLVISPRELFYHDLPVDEADYWASRLTNQSLKALFEGGEFAYAGWRDVPVWYIGTVEDRGLPVVMQRMQVGMARAMGGTVEHRELPTSHSPFLSRPEETVGIVLEAVEAFTGKSVESAPTRRGEHNERPQWQRSRSNPTPQTTAPKPPLPVSATTKNKLRAFQFEPSAAAEPPNADPALNQTSPPAADRAKGAVTPAHRPAWQDLLRKPEAPDRDQENSPSERLLWCSDYIENPPVAISPLLPRKGRKRARSSSPVSSPSSKRTTPAIDTKKLAQVLKTPRADPALELWDRFSLPGKDASPSGLTNPLLAQLLVSSSPRPPKDSSGSGSDRSLRKSISCGSHWPKRRKIERADSDRGDTAGGDSLTDSKSFMVSTLLETVDGEIKKSKSAVTKVHQPLKSPSPTRAKAQGPAGQSPVQPQPGSSPLAQKSSRANPEANNMVEIPSAAKASSDYGDDDFDDDTFMALDASVHLAQGDESTLVVSSEEVSQALPGRKATEDDFGDVDDDFFDGAADLIDELEAKHLSQSNFQGKLHGKPVPDSGGEDDTYGDDFGDFDFDDIELAVTQAASHPFSPNLSQKPKAIQRYLVTNVLDSSYTDERGREAPEKILLVQAERTNAIKTVHLRNDWYDTQASPKAYVHIIGNFGPSGRCVIDNNHNTLILHPDQLVSATVVADSFTCMRRAVLQDRVKATSEATPALVYGTILHEIFQEALMANNWDLGFLGSVINRTLQKHLEDLYVIKVSLADARSHVMSKMPELKSWAQAFVSASPKPNAFVHGKNGEKVNMCVGKLLDVEEHVWSPMYGLKGNIDATVQVTMQDGKTTKTLTVPFEVKTGKNATTNHQAQTVLYNLLLSDRYDIEAVYGILYYMETSQTLRIPAIRHELRHMIMQRNQLACYIRERSVQLPPMKRSKNACGKCYAQTSCFTYHKLADGGDGETSGLNEKFDDVVKHLTPTHREFFLKWEDLLTKEEKESQKLRRELWTMVSTEREKLGRCFANVIIEEGSASEDKSKAKINRFSYSFVKENPASSFSFLDSQLTVGEPIVISDEQGHFALALGYVTAVKKQRISVAVDRRLHNARIRQPGFDSVNNQVFASIMDVAPEGAKPEQSRGKIKEAPIRYRLDKDEFSNGMATVRNNLVQVMADGPFGSAEIRRLVVDLVPPRFKTTPTQYTVPGKDSLNVDQKAAVEKVMSARDYALVLGMPGTGKTTTIAHIIRALIGQGKTLLLTSYTHTAVDNILLKLKDDNIPILRLGAPAKVHSEVQDFATLAGQPMRSFDEIRRAWHETPIVATTCLGINHPIFNERTFDYCIVDEASQITLPICLGPIRMARTFVLVGDHNQLPPLVQNEEARLGGLDVSLFKLLSDTHPQSVVNLEHQYRMSEDIMTLSSTLIYNGRLKCGTEALRFTELHVPNMDALRSRHFDASSFISYSQQQEQRRHHPGCSPSTSPYKGGGCLPITPCPSPRLGACWLADLVHPSARVRFVNTDALLPESREQAKGNRIVNPCEARVVAQLVDALLAVGVPASEIGVVTHYRSQLALLKHTLRNSAGAATGDAGMVEMHTADRFQGRDKSVVVLSLVRSNEGGGIGELLKDWRRINVAFTRAKTKLLVVGSKDTLGGCGEGEMLARFVRLMEEKEWIYELKRGALERHLCGEDGAGTQGTAISVDLGAGKDEGEGGNGMAKGQQQPRKKGGLLLFKEKEGKGKLNGKENQWMNDTMTTTTMVQPKKTARIGERALLRGKPVLRDILNDMMDGGY